MVEIPLSEEVSTKFNKLFSEVSVASEVLGRQSSVILENKDTDETNTADRDEFILLPDTIPSEEASAWNEEMDDTILSIHDLPKEVLLRIFSFVDTRTVLIAVELVCKSWRELVEGSFWTSLRFLAFEDQRVSTELFNLISKCPNLRNFRMTAMKGDTFLVNAAFFLALSHLRKLESLGLEAFWLSTDCAESIGHIFDYFPLLHTLKLTLCKVDNEVGEALAEFLPRGDRLRCLSLAGHCIEDDTLTKVIRKGRCIEHIDLSSAFHLKNYFIYSQPQMYCSSIKSLNLTGIRIDDSALVHIRNCSQLSTLNLYCPRLTDQTLLRIRALPLRHLELVSGSKFSSAALKEFFEKGSVVRLQHLNVSGCSKFENSTLKTVAGRCPELAVLSVGNRTKVTDEGIRAISNKCPKLRALDLERLKQVSGEFLEDIDKHPTRVRYIDLAYCDYIDFSLVKRFVESHPHVRIEELPHFSIPTFGREGFDYDSKIAAIDETQSLFIISKNMNEKLSNC